MLTIFAHEGNANQTTMRQHYLSLRITKIEENDQWRLGKDAEALKLIDAASRNVQW